MGTQADHRRSLVGGRDTRKPQASTGQNSGGSSVEADRQRIQQRRAVHVIRGAWLRYLARKKCDALRQLRADALIQMMHSVNNTKKKIGRTFGLRTSFNAPGTKTSTLCSDKRGVVMGQPKGHKRTLHPDIPWLERGLTVFYNENNPECLKNVKAIAIASQGRSRELREKLLKKYPNLPQGTFDWLLRPPVSGLDVDPLNELTNSPMNASLGMNTTSGTKLSTSSACSNDSSVGSMPSFNQCPPAARKQTKRSRANTSLSYSPPPKSPCTSASAGTLCPPPSGRLASSKPSTPGTYTLRLSTPPNAVCTPSVSTPRTPVAFISNMLKGKSPEFGMYFIIKSGGKRAESYDGPYAGIPR